MRVQSAVGTAEEVDGAPGEIRTPDPLLRSFGVRKSKCLIVRCIWAKVILKPVLSWATWATTNFDSSYLVIRHPLSTRGNRMGIQVGLCNASLLVRCHAPRYRHLYVLSC